jgi:hypothetical protein
MINESTDIKNEAFKLPSQLVINQEFGTIPSKDQADVYWGEQPALMLPLLKDTKYAANLFAIS